MSYSRNGTNPAQQPQPAPRSRSRGRVEDYSSNYGSYAAPSRRGYAEPNPRMREELFEGSGYDPTSRRYASERVPGGYPAAERSRRYHPQEHDGYFYSQEDEQDAYNAVYDEIEEVKSQSVASTRNALRRLNEAEELAAASTRRLQEQNDKLAKVEESMTQADYHAQRSANKTSELETLNRNFIVSTVTSKFKNPFNRGKRREQKLQRELDEKNRLAAEKESLRREAADNRKHMDARLAEVQHRDPAVPHAYGGMARSRSNYLPEEENCEKEREIDSNLDQISAGLSRLKVMALGMNEGIARSNDQISRISERSDAVQDRVQRNEARLGRMVKK